MPLDAKELAKIARAYEKITPLPGLIKTAACAALVLPFAYLGLSHSNPVVAIIALITAALGHAAWLITTHDAGHRTLTGWRWFDELVPRLISYPVFWTHGIYTEIHKLHHRMNGQDLNDPERVQRTEDEYNAAPTHVRFFIRHQWVFNLFVFAGIGLIYKNVSQAAKHWKHSKGIRHAVVVDTIGITLGFITLYYTFGWRVLIALFLVDRITGAVLQFRAHVEHYGLWGKGEHFFATQIFNCRNIRTSKIVSWYFNHLNYHSVHHAFPRIPFYHLASAHAELVAITTSANTNLVETSGYLASGLQLAANPCVIPSSQNNGNVSIPISTAAS